jgi:tetratricopeptide (TPR) repeat protein
MIMKKTEKLSLPCILPFIRLIFKVITISFLPLILFNCSAYFNGYYNGELAFKEGYELHNKVMKNFPDSLLVTAPQGAITKYDRAIEKANKVRDIYPKKVKWHDDALFLVGKSCYYKKEFQRSIRYMYSLQEEFPASPYIPETFVYIGRNYIEEGSLDKAENVLEMARQKYPNIDNNQQITLLLIEIAIRREGRSQAIGLLEKMLKSAKTDDKKIELTIRISQLYIQVKQYQKAIPLLIKAPRNKDKPHLSYKLDYALLICYIETSQLDAALNLIKFMSASRLYSSYSDEMLFQKGIIFKKLKNYDGAIETFLKICNVADSSSLKHDTTTYRGKAYYELALIYQFQKKDYTKAQEYYAKAGESRDTSIVPLANRRVAAMKELAKLREEKKDTTFGRKRIVIGELFRFDLEEPDSAYNEFIALSKDSSADSSLIPKALCAAAIIARDDKKDTVGADSLFKQILKQYPSSGYAQLVQRLTDVPVTIKTRSDSANLAYKTSEELFYKENDVKGAIKSFYSIYKNYPELEIAQKSLFAAAWYSDNVLQKKKTAKSLYEKLCEKYPVSIYCTSEALPKVNFVKDTLAALDAMRRKMEQMQNRKATAIKESKASTSTANTSDSASNSKLLKDDILGSEELSDSLADPVLNKLPVDTTKKANESLNIDSLNRNLPVSGKPENPIPSSPPQNNNEETNKSERISNP